MVSWCSIYNVEVQVTEIFKNSPERRSYAEALQCDEPIEEAMMPQPRYDPDRNLSRHAAVDADCCEEMARKYGWKLVDTEPLEHSIFEVDCVFAGPTEFPESYYETEKENASDA